MEITCENCDYNNKAGPEVVAHCKKCKQRGRIGYWEPKSPAQVPDILTPENARDGMTIRKACDISMPRTLRWCKELTAWVYCHRGQWCHLRDETMGEWKIVSEPPEPPIVSTDQNYPPELPIGHVDAPDSVLKALGERIDDNITRIEAFVDQSDGAEIPEFKRFIEAMHVEFDNMQRIIGDKANSRTVEPEPTGHWKCPCGVVNSPDRSDCRNPECNLDRQGNLKPEPEPGSMPDIVTIVDEFVENWRKRNG